MIRCAVTLLASCMPNRGQITASPEVEDCEGYTKYQPRVTRDRGARWTKERPSDKHAVALPGPCLWLAPSQDPRRWLGTTPPAARVRSLGTSRGTVASTSANKSIEKQHKAATKGKKQRR